MSSRISSTGSPERTVELRHCGSVIDEHLDPSVCRDVLGEQQAAHDTGVSPRQEDPASPSPLQGAALNAARANAPP
jgi:hypothetical protein